MSKAEPNRNKLYKEATAAYGRALERLARAYEADRDRQQDLLQEIHMAIWRSFEVYESRCAIRTWVYRVAHNTAAKHVGRERRASQETLITLEEMCTLSGNRESRSVIRRMIIPVSASIYRTVRRIRSPHSIEEGATSPCLDFYRKHVSEHHRAVILKWQLLVPTMLFLWLGVTFIGWSFLILRVLFPSLLVLTLFLRQWEIRKLRRHLAVLDDFENGGRDL